MRTRVMLGVLGGVAALAGDVGAQAVTTTQMPGVPVGNPLLTPVGVRIPQAVPAAGTPINRVAPGSPQVPPNTQQPPGVPIDLSNVIAPYPGMPKPKPSVWDELARRWASLFASEEPAQRPAYTPGIARRNEERRERREGVRRRD